MVSYSNKRNASDAVAMEVDQPSSPKRVKLEKRKHPVMSKAIDIEGTSKGICLDEEEPTMEGGGTMVEYERPTDMSPVS